MPLSDAALRAIEVLLDKEDESEVIQQVGTIPVTPKDLYSLQPKSWLNDEVRRSSLRGGYVEYIF